MTDLAMLGPRRAHRGVRLTGGVGDVLDAVGGKVGEDTA